MVVTVIFSRFLSFRFSLISDTWALYGDRIAILCCSILAVPTSFWARSI